MEIALLLGGVFLALVALAIFFGQRDPGPSEDSTASMAAVPTPQRSLFALVDAGELEALKPVILDKPERVGLRDGSGWTPLHHAAYRDHPEIISFLIDHGADPNAVAEGECAPIHMVATDGSPDAAKRLTTAGADPSLPDDSGATPLHYAVLPGRTEMVSFLLEAGAQPNMKNAQQQTPLDVAQRMGHEEIVTLLEDKGGRPGAEVRMADVLAALPVGAAARSMVPTSWRLDVTHPLMETAMGKARDAFPALLTHLETTPDARAAVKFAVRGEGVIEHVWGEVRKVADPFEVELQSAPVAVAIDDTVLTVAHEDVIDWQVVLDEDRTAGGYGQRATYEAIRAEYGFLPPSTEEELSHLVDLPAGRDAR